MGMIESQESFQAVPIKCLEGKTLSAHLLVVEIHNQAGVTSLCITAGALSSLKVALIFGFLLLADDLYATLMAIMLA